MVKGTIVRLGLGTLGTTSVAAPSLVAAHKSHQVNALVQDMDQKQGSLRQREEAVDAELKELDQKMLEVKKREENLDVEARQLVVDTNQYKDLYQVEVIKSRDYLTEKSRLKRQIEDLQVKIAEEDALLATQLKNFEQGMKVLMAEKEKLLQTKIQ